MFTKVKWKTVLKYTKVIENKNINKLKKRLVQ